MRRRVATAVLATALGMLLHACAQPKISPPTAPAKIVLDHTEYDFGAVEQGTSVHHAYALKNAGGLDLTIDNVRTACGCTATAGGAHTLAPGASGSIEVTCDTADAFGPQNRTLTVYSNDPATPAVTLKLTGSVHADVAVDPPQLYVGHLGRAQAAVRDVRLIGSTTVQLGALEVMGTSVEAALAPPSGGTSDKRLHISIRKDAPLGRFTDTITVRTSSPRHSLVSIPVTGVVDGNVVITPAELNFGTTTPQAQVSRVIGLQHRGPRALHISGAHLQPDLGTAVATPIGNEHYRVTVTLKAG